MQKEVKKSWALFTGIGIMMIAHGLQIQVMGIRSVIEDFSVITTGVFMSSYFVGYFGFQFGDWHDIFVFFYFSKDGEIEIGQSEYLLWGSR